MNKTRLGINEYLFTALIFAAAIWGPVPMFGLILYAAIVEKSEIINAGSKTALLIKVGALLLQSFLNFIEYVVRTFATDAYDFYSVMSRIDYLIEAAVLCAMIVFVIINAAKGFAKKPEVRYINPQPQPEAQPAAPQAQSAANAAPKAQEQTQTVQPGTTVCPQCKKAVAIGTTFCAGCGYKLQ